MDQAIDNRRKYQRYETDTRIEFRVPYDFEAEVDFRITEEIMEGRERTYAGFSRDISIRGISFRSPKRLDPGDLLWMDFHLPKSDQVVFLRGEVCWCQALEVGIDAKAGFLAGVKINTVDGHDVDETVYFDKAYGVVWSELLERVLGGFAKLNRKKT